MSWWMMDFDIIYIVGDLDGEVDFGIISIVEDKGIVNRNKRKGIVNVDNRKVIYNEEMIGGNNFRILDIFQIEVGFLEIGIEIKQIIGYIVEIF